MDNFRIDITSEGQASLLQALGICFAQHRAATHYVVREAEPPKPRRLVFMWTEAKDAVALPFKLDVEGAADFARRWLDEQDFGRQPDHDGDNGKGWRLYNEAWGHVDNQYQGWIAVAPAWAMYGK